jgi:hypothetical protein
MRDREDDARSQSRCIIQFLSIIRVFIVAHWISWLIDIWAVYCASSVAVGESCLMYSKKEVKALPVRGLEGRETFRIPHCLDNRLTDGDQAVSPTVTILDIPLRAVFYLKGLFVPHRKHIMSCL